MACSSRRASEQSPRRLLGSLACASAFVALGASSTGCSVGQNEPPPTVDGGRTPNESAGTDYEAVGGVEDPDSVLRDTSSQDVDPCQGENPPQECFFVPSGPACGDGNLDVPEGEECDDGNSLPGDGCNGICRVEAYHVCPTPGELCVSTIVCGDGEIGPGEACDDGNVTGGDGCSESCNLVEKGYVCRVPGATCVRVYLCGDGITDPVEGCDDGNAAPGDGCDEKCRMETGFKCEGTPSVCSPTVCGDGIQEGAESCDDGNAIPFDGCSVACQAEPQCDTGACSSGCGDGIVLGEQCDDGNLRNGDGCSDTCTIEPGFECTSNADPCVLVNDICTMSVPAVFRDFRTGGDFEPADAMGQYNAVTGLVADQLDADGKPVFVGTPGAGYITSADSFAQWYRDVSGVNATKISEIVLWQTESGTYVNRHNEDGTPWQNLTPPGRLWCGNVGEEIDGEPCTFIYGGTQCEGREDELVDCVEQDGTWWGIFLEAEFDGDPLFFPVDDVDFTPAAERSAGLIPSVYTYDGGFVPETGSPLHNFHFTSEVRYWFTFTGGQEYELGFTGDDDVWVFVNGILAADLGGIHTPVNAVLTIHGDGSATSVVTATVSEEANVPLTPTTQPVNLGLQDGQVYEIVVFQAERKVDASSYRLTLSGFDVAPSDCNTACGDGEIAIGEECDDGSANNTGEYNMCSPSCTLGPRCGDGITQDQYGEACDNGVNDGSYGECSPTCQIGPHCGDGIVDQGYEQCDDGVNTGEYGQCAENCVLGPYCGDGVLNLPYEECDDGNNEDFDHCSAACRDERILT